MKIERSVFALFISFLLTFTCLGEKTPNSPSVKANARQGKKVSLAFMLPEKTDLDKFMRTNRLMAGMWLAQRPVLKKGGKPGEMKMVTRETKTHWIGDVHYPIFNYRNLRLYMIDGIKIRKTPAIDALPPKKKKDLLKVLHTRGDLVLKETGKPREYDVIGFHDGVERVFSLFTLNNKWMFEGAGKPKVLTINLNSGGGIRIGEEGVPLDKLAEKLYGLFPTKVIVRVSGEVPDEKIMELRKVISKEFFWSFDLEITNDGD
jgi:hypothetical protein